MDIVEIQKWAFIPTPPDDIAPCRDLLVRYSKIPPKDVDAHLIRIRDKAWAHSRAPFIGRWRFLRLLDSNDPVYRQVLHRLSDPQSPDTFLDLGCGFGQALRQLRADGVHGSRLEGLDTDAHLIDLGYELFRDRDTLGATLLVKDAMTPDDEEIHELDGKVTIVHAGSFFHLFSWADQLFIAQRIVKFLKPGTHNALIYGTSAAISSPQHPATGDSSPYLHNKESFQQLWDEVGELTRTKWRVEVQMTALDVAKLPVFARDVQAMAFAVHQIAPRS